MRHRVIYEYARFKDILPKEGLMIIIAHTRTIVIDGTGTVRHFYSHKSHSLEYKLDEVPDDIKSIEEIPPTQITRDKFDELNKLYENDVKQFLFYTPENLITS